MKQRIIGFTLALALLLFGLSAGVQAQVTIYSATADGILVASTVKVVCISQVSIDASTASASVAIIDSASTAGKTIKTLKCPTTDAGDVKVFDFPDYIWVSGGVYLDVTNVTNVDVHTVLPDGTRRVKLTYSGSAATYRDNWIRDGSGKPQAYTVASGSTITCSDAFAYSQLTGINYAYWSLADF